MTPAAPIPSPVTETAECVVATPPADGAHPAGPAAAALPARAQVRASLHLEFTLDAASGRTRLHSSRQDPPLKAVRSFEAADGAALLHLHNVSGGLLGGDELSLKVNLAPSSIVQLTTTGATRIYRPRTAAAPTQQNNEISVGENALLEYVPDPIIPYAGARFSQRTMIHLAPGAGLFWWEILAPGREAHGEIFQYEILELRTDVTAHTTPICSERVRLEPCHRDLSSLARMGNYRYWATFYICRVGVEPPAWRSLEDRIRGAAPTLDLVGPARWGVSTLPSDGMVIRGLVQHGRDAYAGLLAFWRVAKRALYSRAPVLPRKVN
jgi:urease accessory protein